MSHKDLCAVGLFAFGSKQGLSIALEWHEHLGLEDLDEWVELSGRWEWVRTVRNSHSPEPCAMEMCVEVQPFMGSPGDTQGWAPIRNSQMLREASGLQGYWRFAGLWGEQRGASSSPQGAQSSVWPPGWSWPGREHRCPGRKEATPTGLVWWDWYSGWGGKEGGHPAGSGSHWGRWNRVVILRFAF